MTFPERLRRIRASGLSTNTQKGLLPDQERLLPDIEARVQLIEAFLARQTNTHYMMFFVMYDIEDHRIRRHIAKYLLKQGCSRVQKSVFIGSALPKQYREIAATLEQVNSMYDNADSIMMLPVTRDNMSQLNVIGKNLRYKMATEPPKILII